jgi:hypothetical protein
MHAGTARNDGEADNTQSLACTLEMPTRSVYRG